MPKLPPFACLLFALGAPAQKAADKPPDPIAMVSDGEKRCTRGDAEGGLLVLWDALALLDAAAPHPLRGAAAMTARTLIERHDPLAAERKAAFTAVANAQVAVATAYRAKKWFDTAADRLDVAASFDAAATTKEREALERARPKAPAAPVAGTDAAPAKPGKAARNPLFDRANTLAVLGQWQDFEGQRLLCAAHDGGQSLSSWYTKTMHEDGRFTVEIVPVDPARDRNAAICVGVVDTTTFVGVRMATNVNSKTDVLTVYRLLDNVYQSLGSAGVPHVAAADGSQRLVVEVRGPKVRVWVGDCKPLEVDLGTPVRGALGLAVGIRDEPSCAVEFRRFEPGPLPIDEPSDAELRANREAAAQNAIVAEVDAARADLAKKQFEPAALRLRAAGRLMQDVAPGLLRDNLTRTIDELVDRADALAPRRRKAAQDCVNALVGLADAYEQKGLARAAQRFAAMAATFTSDGMPERMQKAQAAVDAWNVRQATQRAAELAPPADDGAVLRDWFEKGNRLHAIGAMWRVDGPALRVTDLAPGEISVFLPRFGMPVLQKAAVSVRLPATDVGAGFCVDLNSPNDYVLVELVRQREGLSLRSWRWRNNQWTSLGTETTRIDAWRLDGWFELAVEMAGSTLTATCGELKLTIGLLANSKSQFGFAVNNGAGQGSAVELRAFRLGP